VKRGRVFETARRPTVQVLLKHLRRHLSEQVAREQGAEPASASRAAWLLRWSHLLIPRRKVR
jgi:hypothetical protein